MKYRDTRDSSRQVSFRTAVLQGMDPETGGLYIPMEIPALPKSFLSRNPVPSFRDIAFEAAKPFVSGGIPESELMAIIADDNTAFETGAAKQLSYLGLDKWTVKSYSIDNSGTLVF